MGDAIANFHFIRPWWLLLAPAVFGVWWIVRKQFDPLREWRSQMDADLLRALTVEQQRRRGDVVPWWLVGALLATVAVAGPTWRLEPSPFAEDTSPLLLLLNASDHMDREDLPTSPMKRAQLKITDLAEQRKGQPLGLMAYAGSAHLVLPPTTDTDVVATMASNVDAAIMPVPGDRLDVALRRAGSVLSEGAAGGSLLIVTNAIEGDASAIEKAAAEVHEFPILVLSLAPDESTEATEILSVARSIDATVQPITADDADVTTLAATAARQSLTSIAGKSTRWQEVGFWLVPVIALMTALSFRREKTINRETSP